MKGSYLQLLKNGELQKRAEKLMQLLQDCTLCPRECHVNRIARERGFCKTARHAIISSVCPHHGEEPPISGFRGSGTIFFTHCNLACMYCQNYDISQLGEGEEVVPERLAEMMLTLQKHGCHNINVVAPSHVIAQIVETLVLAAQGGLTLPLVYNSNGYDSVATLRLLEGIIDIYMPDMKYASDDIALGLSQGHNYWDVSKQAIQEMFRQVGPLERDEHGVAERGLLVRHLVLPHNLSGSDEVLRFLAEEVSRDLFLSVMAQYHPCYKAQTDKRLGRKITHAEYDHVLNLVEHYGFANTYCQALSSADIFLPDFDKEDPFE